MSTLRRTLSRVILAGGLALSSVVLSVDLADSNSVQIVQTQNSDWHGNQKQSFAMEGHGCFVVVPKIAAPGKPWVWRTSFPDFHAEVDIELVRNGYHIGYIDVVDMIGSDPSLDLMDKFYTQVRAQWKLAGKPALEAVSRGGLHAYRYAAKYPERIACIYADTPVMNLASWPLKWQGSKSQVQDALKYYGFRSEDELKAYKRNPIDLMESLAKVKMPIRHVISLSDKVVPPEENSLEAKRRLEKLGWNMDVVTVTEGTKESNGHHFPLPEFFQSARFIMKHAYVLPKDREYFELRNGLGNCKAKFETEKSGRVAFVGGSITFNPGWRDELMRYLQQKYPETKFDFISTGIPSVGSAGHAFRLERDVLARGPVDLVFVESAVNDHNHDGQPDAEKIIFYSMEGVVKHLRIANPKCDVVLMHFIHNLHLADWKAGKTPAPLGIHEKVADYYGCPSLNLSLEVSDRINAGEFTWAGDFRDLHPSPYGQRVYANSMTRMLDSAFSGYAPGKSVAIPEKMLDQASYDKGRYGKLEDAKLGKGFTLEQAWRPAKGSTRDGFANVPALVSSDPGSEFSYEFTGNAFGLFIAAGYDTCVLEYSVDSGEFKKNDTHTQWSGGLHIPWVIMLADGLNQGKHNITVRTTDQAKNRTALHVIHILLN